MVASKVGGSRDEGYNALAHESLCKPSCAYPSPLGISRSALQFVLTRLTSIPASRDAPCNETNRRYFEFKGLQIYKDIKNFICFCFNCIIYLS